MNGATQPRRRWICVCAALLAACLLAGCRPRSDDQRIVVQVDRDADTEPASPAEIERAAGQEGQFTWYTSLPEDVARGLLDRFEAKYPQIRTRLERDSTFTLVSQINDELDKGQLNADALHVLDVGVFIDLKRQGQLMMHRSPEYRAFGREFKDDGYWGAMRMVALCLAYNPNNLPANDAPKTWEDLLRPEFAHGKIGLKDARTAGSAYAAYYFLRDRYGSRFWERLGDQHPQILGSAREVIRALVENRIDVAAEMIGNQAYAARQDGEPIEIVWPPDGVPVVLGPIAILEQAKHPNAAKMFIDFALSQEGQEYLKKLSDSYSVRADVPPPEGRPTLDELSKMTPIAGWEDYFSRQPLYQGEFGRFFALED